MPEIDNESRKWLYQTLTSPEYGLNLGTPQEFDSLMTNNEESRKWLWEQANSFGLNVGANYDEFNSLVNPAPQRTDVSDVQQAEQANAPVAEVATQPQQEAIPTATMEQVDNVGHYQPRSGAELKTPEQLEAEVQNSLPTPTTENEPKPQEVHGENLSGFAYPFNKGLMHEDPNRNDGNFIGNVINNPQKGGKEDASSVELNNAYAATGDQPYELPTELNEVGYNEVLQKKNALIAEKKQIEKRGNMMLDTDIEPSWAERDRNRAKIIEAELDKVLKYEYSYLRTPEGQAYLDRYDEMCDQMDAAIKEAGGDNYSWQGRLGEAFANTSPTDIKSLTPEEEQRQKDMAEYGNKLIKAKRDVKNVRREVRKTRERLNGDYSGFRRGWRATDVEGLSGINDFADKMTQLELAKKVREGKPLDKVDEVLLRANELKSTSDMNLATSDTMWEHIGSSTAEQLVTTAEFLAGSYLTGATDISGKVAGRVMSSMGSKAAEEAVVSSARNLLRAGVAEVAGMAAGAAVQTFANPLSYLSMMADYADKRTGTIYYDQNDGQLHYFDNNKSIALSLWQAAAGAYIENFTEFSGEGIDKIGKLGLNKLFSAAPELKSATETIKGLLDKVKFSDLSGLNAPAMDDFLRHAGFNGTLGEFGEEVLGNIIRPFAYVETENGESYGKQLGRGLKNLVDADQNLETFLSCAITSAVLGTVGTVRRTASDMITNSQQKAYDEQMLKDVRDNIAKLDAMMNGVRGLDKEAFKEFIANNNVADISQYIKEQAKANNWTSDELGMVALYVSNVAQQNAMANQNSEAIQQSIDALNEQTKQLVNEWDGEHIYNVTFKDPKTGEELHGAVVNGRMHYTQNDDGTYNFNPYVSSGMLAIRMEDGSVRQVSSRAVTSLDNVTTAAEQNANQGQIVREMMEDQFKKDELMPTVESAWGFEFEPGATEINGLTFVGKDKDGNYQFQMGSNANRVVKMSEEQVISWGLRQGISLMQQQAANGQLLKDISADVQKMSDDADLMDEIDQLKQQNTRGVTAHDLWKQVIDVTSKFVSIDENGLYDEDNTSPNDAAVDLYARAEGNVAAAKENVAKAKAALMSASEQGSLAAVGAFTGSALANQEAQVQSDEATTRAAKQIAFLEQVENVLDQMGARAQQLAENDAKEEAVKVSSTPVSQMEVGQQFPVEWRGQQAMATVMGKDADGRSVVTVRDMDGEDIEAGIDDMSDAQWEAVRVQPQEATAPEQAPPQAPEQVEPQQELPQAAPQQEPQQAHPLDDFIAKHGENAENKLGVTVDAINKEIASLAKDLDKAEKDLANMPEPYDEKTQKAQDKQEEKIAKLRADLDEKRNILAPYAAMQEELDRRKEVRQGRENGVTDALTKFTERLNNMLHPKRESQEGENDFRNIYEFIARKMSRKGIGRTSVKTYNKKTGKTTNGWRYVRPVDSFDIDSFKAETGWKDSEIDGFKDPIQPFFVKEGGKTFGEFVHSVWESAKEEGIIPENSSDADVRDAVIAFLQEVQSVKDINDYIEKHRRDEQAEQEAMANDMIAQQNGYESGEAMENDLIAQASAKADELLGSDTLSDEDVAAFDAELSQRLDNLVPSIEETAEENESATQETTVENTEDEDFIQPTDEEVPFSVVANDFQKRFEEIDSKISEAQRASQGRRILALKKEKAALIQDFINKIKTDDFTVLTEDNYEEVLRRNGVGTGAIKQVKDALRQARLNGDSIGGFRINGMIYMFSDDIESIEHARTTYVHERQHNLTDKTKVTENSGKVVSLRDWIKKVSTREQLKAYVRRMCGSPFYDNKSDDVLADEFVSMAMELAYTSDDVEAALKSKGIENKQLINTIKLLSDEQRKSNTLSKARKGEGRNLHVDNNVESDGGQDDGDRGSRPAEVGGQRPRPVSRGKQTTERRESVKGDVSGILPIDQQTPKNTTIDQVLYSIKVNHNSPYLLKKADGSFIDPETGERLGFDHRFMSNGEGAQAHGWGSYFSVNDLRSYAGQVKNDIYYQGKLYDVNEVNNHISEVGQRALNWFLYGVEPDKYTNDKDGMLSIIDKAINSYEVLWSGEKDDYYNRQIEQFKDMRKFVEEHGDEIRIEPQRHHYNVEIPDNNGTNYFEESEPLKPEQIAMLQKQSDKENAKVEIGGFLFYANPNKNPNAEKYTFRNFLSDITSPQGGITQKQASEFFSRAGFVGTHYDGKRDGECYVIFDENDAKIVDHVRFSVREKNNSDLRFSTNGTHVISNGKSLVGIHNIGAEKLRKAMKNGGFANPSAAVIDIDKQEHKGYGEVSLIMPSSLVDSRTGRNAGTYAGDAYTPEYPSVSYREGKNTDKLVKDLVKGLPKELGWAIRQGIGEYMDGNRSRSGLEYLFLKEKGQEMPIVKNERRYPDISTEQIDKRLGVEESATRGNSGELYAAYEKLEGDDLVDFNMWFEAYGDEEKIKQRKDLMERNAKVKEMLEEQFGEHMGYGKFDTTWYNILRDERDAGKENIGRTLEDAAIEIDNQGLRSEFEQWKQNTIEGLGYEEVIFDGYTPSGYSRYVPNTVENASRIMNKKDKTNWLSDAGTHATKAMLLDKFNTLNDIRKNRGLLESDQEVINQAYEEASDAWSELGSELAEMQKVDDNRFINHYIALNRLQEAMMKSNPVAYLNKEYKYNLDEEFNDRIKEVKQQIKSLPSKYFETKFRRPVYLNEFAAAVVPNDLPQDLKERLQQSGLPLFEYDPNKEGDRRAVTLEATEGDGIRFSVANRNQAIFVSNAARAVDGIKQEKATPEQWLKMIEKNGGLKAGEDKWLGLSQWLKDQANTDAPRSDESLTEWAERNRKKTITKQEVLDFINENAIKIEETHYGNRLSADSEAMQPWQEEFREEIENAEMLYDDADNRLEEFYSDMEDKYGADYLDQMDEDELAMEERLLQEREDVNTDYRPAYQIAFDAMVDDHGDDFGLAFYPTPSGLQISDEDAASYFLGGNQINSVRMQYTTEGLDNKREIALTVPTIEPWNENDEIHFGDAGEGRAVAWIRFGETKAKRELTDAEKQVMIDALPKADQWMKRDGSQFVNKHDIYVIPDSNQLGFGDYIVDRDGKFVIDVSPSRQRRYSSFPFERTGYDTLEEAVNAYNDWMAKTVISKQTRTDNILVIDEIQSKRHQEGREKGYLDNEETKRLYQIYDDLQKREYDILQRQRAIFDEIASSDEAKPLIGEDGLIKPGAEKDYDNLVNQNTELKELNRQWRENNQAKQEAYNNWRNSLEGIPTAPFEKNWMELAMKRMLRLAAEEGYDKVAWTTGEQQAERYNLGKFYDTIGREDKDDNYRRYVLSGNNVDEIVIDEQNRVVESSVSEAEGKPLSEVVGMDMAVKMENMNDGDELSGNDLRIGGEGMKGFYDKMIPSFMNKYGKQWGVKVGEVTMPNLEEGYQTMHSIDVNEQMKADVMEGQVMFSVKNSQKDADDNQLSLFLQNNTGEYETQDGQTIGFTSLLGAATEADAVRGRDNVQRGDDILSYQLRRLEPGETCHVERRYQKSKMFDFTGSEKIESADDVAYIFNKLEDAAVENSFIVFVKDGKPTIIHTGVGSYGSTYVSAANALVAYKNINPDEVWFVHNHPSGSITSSQPDRDSSKKFEKVFGKKYKGGIIIDTTSGKYGVFDSKSDTESGSTRNTPSNETDIDVYEFSKQVFDKDWNPETAFRARTHEDVATFVSSHRLGEHDKMSLLVLNNNLNVVGNVFLPYESIGEADIKKLTDDILYYTNQMAGTQAIIYGSFTADDVRDIKKLANNIANAEGRLTDVISTNSEYTGLRSARLMGAIKEEVQEIKEDEARFSVTAQQDKDYMDAVNRGDMKTAQRMVDEAAQQAGYTINGYHGTTQLFNIFDQSKGNEEGNWGRGFYFTNNNDDAEANYASSEGADLNNKIEQLAEQLEWRDGYEDMDYEQRKEEARKMLDGGENRIISAALRMENPLVIGTHADMPETFFDYDEGYNEETDEYEGEPTGLLVDFVEAWNDVINDYEWEHNNIDPYPILEDGYGGYTASQLETKAREVAAYIETNDGQLGVGEFLRQVFERMGFDGIIDSNVNFKFGTQRKTGQSMEGMDYGTIHFIANQPNQIKQSDPVTYDDQGNVIPLSERFNPNNNDIRFSVNGQQRIAVADEFNRRTGANMDNVSDYVRVKESLIRDWFDGLHPLEQAQKLIEEKLGRKLRDSEKAYELATQTTSVSAAMIDEEEKKHIIPILNKATELIRKMMDNDRLSRKEAYRRLSNYMLAKHGLERNKWFHEQALLSDPNAEEEDKSGLTGLAAMLGENPDEYKAVAERIVKEFEDEYDSQEIDDYWNEMRGLTNRLLEISYESGMIDKDTYDNLKKRHKFYVPLRGFGEGTIGDMFDYIGQMPHFQETLKKAKGRKSVAGDPLANLYNMLQSAIVIGNQNKVMQKLYNLAVNSNNDLLRLKKTWYVYDDVEDRWEERYPDIPKDATDAEIDAIVKKFDADMQAAKANGKAKTKLNKLDLAKKVLPYQAKQHEMVAYIDGKKVILQVVGNPVLAQALNKANQQQLGIFAESMQGITRFMSMINTSLSPAFMLTNSARDIGFALFSAMVTGGFKKTGQMAAWMATSGWVIPRLMITGKLDAGLVKALGKQNAAQIEQWWNEFTQNGGETGFTRTLSAEKARGQVDDMIRHMLNGSKDGESRLRKSTVGLVESAGRWSEDISRFAAYCWSRAQGNSVMESVNEAKNVTVNFNVKGGGRLAAACRAVYSFFNAALQGIGRMARLAKENPKAFAACLTACMLQGAVLPWLNMVMFGLLGGDDDDWKKYEMLTEYTANKNLVLYVGNHKFLKIPYSQELAPFAAMGNIFFRQQMGWNKGESVASQVGKMFLDLAPVSIGESKTFMGKAIKTATPTALMPFVELWMNEDFTGSPIQKDNQWNKYARGWERAYEGKTSKWLVDASKWLDDKTGIDISPAVAEHMFSGVLGGIGRSGDKLLRYFSNGFQLQDAPFIRTLMFDSKQQGYVGAVQREYGRNAYDVLDKVKHDVENMDAMEFARFSQTEEFEIANLVSIYKTGKDLAGNKRDVMGIDKMEKEYKKLAGMSDGSEEYREHLEAIKADITERKMEMLDEIQQIKYEHSGDLRKRIIEYVNEVEQESKEKNARKNGKEK